MTFALRAALWFAAAAHAAQAGTQPYPARPIRLIVSNASGSSPDILARIVANRVGEQTGQQVVVDTRPGASGIIGVELARAAAPDGYTALLGAMTVFTMLPALKPNLPYDPVRDFVPVTRIASVANVFVVQASLGVGTVAEVVRLARANPGKLNSGSAGNGTPAHLATAMFNLMAGIDTVHVPYKGSAQALNDLIAGHLQLQFTSPIVAMPHAKGGRIRVIATAGPRPDPLIPELPTVAQTLPGFESTQWWGIVLPARTPQALVARLHSEVDKALHAPEVRELLAKQGATPEPESPQAFGAFMRRERATIAELGRRAGVRLD
jgi:tripartite-type tricarboxylate transporter receptor subunit TctC